MITIKNKMALQKMEKAGALLCEVFDALIPLMEPGTTTLDIDRTVAENLQKRGLTSKTKGYMGYKHVSCISVNQEVVHGVPVASKALKQGDLVKVDICASWKGYCADMARAFFVGTPDDKIKRLVEVAQRALDKGIEQARPGNRLGDISAAIQREVEQAGFGIVRDFAGHGIGKQMHEEPEILNYGTAGSGPVLRPGMTFAIEPMVTFGNHEVEILSDGWTVTTRDNSMAAHVEDTVAVTERGPKILTRRMVRTAQTGVQTK